MSWYEWRWWRLAYSRNGGGVQLDGWGRWRHVAFGLFFNTRRNELLGVLQALFYSAQNEMVARGLPLEWQTHSAMGCAEAAIKAFER